MTALKAVVFLLLVPGLLLGYIPYRIAAVDTEVLSLAGFAYLAYPLWLVGGTSMLWCIWNFLVNGKGTPAPIDPPKKLVTMGLYRFVRNPMYVSGILALVGWAFWSPSLPLIGAPLLFLSAAHLFVTLYEEPTLRATFGGEYAEYCKLVPRWIPRIK